LFKDFRAFIARGNVLDLAVAVIIGGAFGKIISSLVNDLLMPVIGLLLGKISFANLFFALDGKSYPSLDAAKAAGVGTINYGLFINAVIDFLIVAFVIFLVVKGANSLQKKKEEAPAPPPEPPAEVKLLTEIRDALRK
jgi:large conductance mechanosensitive channel